MDGHRLSSLTAYPVPNPKVNISRAAEARNVLYIPRTLPDFRERDQSLAKSVLSFPDFPGGPIVRGHQAQV